MLEQNSILPITAAEHNATHNADVIVIHETNGRKYLEAIAALEATGEIRTLTFVEASAFWKLAHSLFRENKSLLSSLRQSARNFLFRFTSISVRKHIIVLALAPWDYRFLWYARLRKNNRVIYNTSWPWWEGDRIPNRMGPLTRLVRNKWVKILGEKSVEIVAVTPSAASAVHRAIPSGNKPTTIPHLASECFYQLRSKFKADPFRILFIGELTEKKGVNNLRPLLQSLSEWPIRLEIIGDGPLRRTVQGLSATCNCVWHGQISDRAKISRIASECQALISPSRRTTRWEELFGISIIEGMALGLPCIATDHVGPTSIITPRVDGFIIQDGDNEAMARCIVNLCLDQGAWESISRNAISTAENYRAMRVTAMWRNRLFGSSQKSI